MNMTADPHDDAVRGRSGSEAAAAVAEPVAGSRREIQAMISEGGPALATASGGGRGPRGPA